MKIFRGIIDFFNGEETLLAKAERTLLTLFIVFLPFDIKFFGHRLPFSLIKVVAIALLCVWALSFYKNRLKFKSFDLGLLFLVFVGFCLLSTFLSPVIPDPLVSNYKYKLIKTAKILFVGLFIYLFYLNLTWERIKFLIRTHAVVGAYVLVVSLTLLLLHIANIWRDNFSIIASTHYIRIMGIGVEPQGFGAYLLLLLPVYMMGAFTDFRVFEKRTLNLPLLILTIFELIMTLSFGAFAGLFVVSLISIYFFRRLIISKWKVITLSLLILALVVVITPPLRRVVKNALGSRIVRIYDSLTTDQHLAKVSSLTVRLDHWTIAFRQFRDYPWFGVGPESYGYFFKKYQGNLIPQEAYPQPPQNFFIGNLTNVGILGFIPLVLLFIVYMFRFLKWYVVNRDSTDYFSRVIIICFIVVVGTLVTQLAYWTPWALNMWFFLTIGYWCMMEGRDA